MAWPAFRRLHALRRRYGVGLADHALASDAAVGPWGPAPLDLERGPRRWGVAGEVGAVLAVTAYPAAGGVCRGARRLALVRAPGHRADLRLRRLARLAARAAAYPAAMLRADPAAAVAALGAAARLRTLRTSGACYGGRWRALARGGGAGPAPGVAGGGAGRAGRPGRHRQRRRARGNQPPRPGLPPHRQHGLASAAAELHSRPPPGKGTRHAGPAPAWPQRRRSGAWWHAATNGPGPGVASGLPVAAPGVTHPGPPPRPRQVAAGAGPAP